MLTIDVEDWYMDTDISLWPMYEDRIVKSTNRILELLDLSNTKATFFILGYVAEHFPELIEKIKQNGHEIASHGYSHKSILSQTPEEFEEDLSKSIKILENITGEKITGYRACQFSITRETSFALDILKKYGIKYDSSVFPIKTHLYGVPDAPLLPYYISSKDIIKDCTEKDLLEIPLSVYKVPILQKNIPVAGGFYFRFFPYWFISYALRSLNKQEKSFIFYIHPWELDHGQPKEEMLKWYHYYNLSKTDKKFEKLLSDFKFVPVREGIKYE